MDIGTTALLGLAMRFDVVIDGYNLGSWNSCKGLSVSFKHEKVAELGEHTYNTYIPGRVEYPVVTLQRAMVKGDWERTKGWLEVVAAAPWLAADNPMADVAGDLGLELGGSSAKITLRDASLAEVATWELQAAMPQAWKGPAFDANGKAVAIETLELIHEGFLSCPSV
jgi:phage tail-like protein